jgi:phosphoglycerate dehydrogenase-like enzyme
MVCTKLVVIAPAGTPALRLLDRLPPDVEVVVSDDPATLAAHAPDARVIVNSIGIARLLRETWPLLRDVEWVHSLSAGVEGVLFPELEQSPVPLTNARGVYKESLGEFVIAAALFFAKDLRRMLRSQQAQRWDQFDVDVLYRQTMGIVGYGEIGRAAASRAKALGMRVYATRRRPELSDGDPLLDQSFPLDRLIDMIRECDYVVACAPLTEATRGMLGEAEIAAMKPSAVIMNVGRGPVIQEAALIRALEEQSIRGAALDVFDEEPLPEGHPYWRLENVLLSPHSADHTQGWMESSVEFFLVNFERFRKGEPLLNIVDKGAGY